VVSGKLKRHVLKNQDKLIQGITNVTNVDDDVKVLGLQAWRHMHMVYVLYCLCMQSGGNGWIEAAAIPAAASQRNAHS